MADRNASVRKYLTEMIGTFVFMFAVLGIVLSHTDCLAAVALGIGSVLMVMVYASGHISGGHLNPAVSVAAYLRGALPASDLGPYIVAQLVGSLAAFSIGYGLWHEKYAHGALDLTGNIWPAFLAELIFTFALCYVVLHTATSKDSAGNSFYGMAIGFTVTVGVVAVGAISGGAFNPAITFGLMLSGILAWKFLWLYLIAQALGAVAAAYAYKATTLDEHTAAARRG